MYTTKKYLPKIFSKCQKPQQNPPRKAQVETPRPRFKENKWNSTTLKIAKNDNIIAKISYNTFFPHKTYIHICNNNITNLDKRNLKYCPSIICSETHVHSVFHA